MRYDQSWMGSGIVGGLEAGAISAAAGLVLFLLLHWLSRGHGWSAARKMGWAFLAACVFTVSGDLWDMFYLNYANLQSVALLRIKLADMHDPEHLGLRVLCELFGVLLGIVLGWLVGDHAARHRGAPPTNRPSP
ncbi:MAG: hypothetical protein WBA65_04140 [Rhodanobacter sp.]